MKSLMTAAFALCLGLGLAACEHDHGDHHHDDVDQVAEGCKHMEFGPEVALEIDNDDPPTSETFHTRYDMTLTEGAMGHSGQLDYVSQGGTHFLIFDQEFEFGMADAEGAAVEPSMVETDPASCELAGVVYHVELPAGTYTFSFDGVPQTLLQMVVHVAGQSHDHDH